MNPTRSGSSRGRTFIAFATAIIGILMQVWLVWVGGRVLWGEDDAEDPKNLGLLFGWCLIASLYLGATVLTLTITARSPQPDSRLTQRIVGHPLSRWLSMLLTFGASVVGLTVAIQLIVDQSLDVGDPVLEVLGVWAMLLSWALFNWGYARIYYSRYLRASAPPLVFPGTQDPRLVDFAYFAFTNATNFSVSDVQVVDSRMRWTVVWHTTLAFFFNALIIGLTINLLINGRLFTDLLGA